MIAPRATAAVSEPRGWIGSPRYDIGLLILPLLAGPALALLALAAPLYPRILLAGVFFILGVPHYLSSYAFYFDDANRTYYRTRLVAFYLGPVVVVGLLTLSLYLHFYNLVAAAVDLWNVFHVSRQSHGILSLYRQLGGGDHRIERGPANLALLGLNGGMYAMVMHHQPNIAYFLSFLPVWAAPLLAPAVLGVGLVALGVLLVRMTRRRVAPLLPEWVFLAASVLLFTPYLVAPDLTLAGSAMLAGHYTQYLALVWLMNRRKYPAPAGSPGQRGLAWISRNLYALLAVLGLLAGAAFVFDRLVLGVGALALHAWAFNVIVLLHFYVDGLCWALRHRPIRDSVAPFLMLADHRRLAPA